MSEPLIGQCPYCDGNLTNGHKCRQLLEAVAGIGLGSRLSVETSKDMTMSTDPRPSALSWCEHGWQNFEVCPQCGDRDRKINAKMKLLVDEFWEYRGRRDLGHLLYRAYRMGMKAERT